MGGGRRREGSTVDGMRDVRVVLIGGTSHAGKSTAARAVADRLGFECRTTDRLARHPGRPWRTPVWEVPPHVAEHYRSLTVDELTDSVLGHYRRLWPRIEELVAAHAAVDGGRGGLVLEGSALWPAEVAALTAPNTAAVWLTADEEVISARMRAESGYDALADGERRLVDAFLARTLRYQALMLDRLAEPGLDRVEVDGRSPEEVADAVLAAVEEQGTVGRPAAGPR
ncbi:hypothetical protein GCM10009605_12480 [Nocardiopsis composta]